MTDFETPTVMGAYSFAWRTLRRYFVELLLIGLVWMLLASPIGIFHRHHGFIPFVYHLAIMVPLNFGGLYVYLCAVRGQEPRLSDLFGAFRSAYAQAIFAHILFVLLAGIGFVLFVVPGIVIASRLAFVAFLVVDEHMDAISAIEESWRRTQGYGATIFCLWLLGVPIAIGGFLLAGVGLIPAVMWIHLAFATLFAAVTASKEDELATLAVSASSPI